jgi:hypothetical protein
MTYDGSTLNVTGDTNVTGAFTAASKSFDIKHPSKVGMRLRYGVLEGPEHGVYVRGVINSTEIILPDYWVNLVHADSITVQLTPIGNVGNVSVVEANSEKVILQSETGVVHHYFFIQGERKDVPSIDVEYEG